MLSLPVSILFCLVFFLFASGAGFLIWKFVWGTIFSSQDGFLWALAAAVVSLLIPILILFIGRRGSILVSATGMFLLFGIIAWGIVAAAYQLYQWHSPTGVAAAFAAVGIGLWLVLAPHYRWKKVRLPVQEKKVVFWRQLAHPILAEYYRKLEVGERRYDLPVNTGGRTLVKVYALQDSSGITEGLYFDDSYENYLVRFSGTLHVEPDTVSQNQRGRYIGKLDGTKGSLEFIPASESPPSSTKRKE